MDTNPYVAPEQVLSAGGWSRWLFWGSTFGLTALVVVALLLPAVRSAREPARRTACGFNLREIVTAIQSYTKAHGHLPPARTFDDEGKPLHSWRTLILPYLVEKPLFESIDLSKPWNDPVNASAREAVVSVFLCPSSGKGPPLTTYQVVVLPDGLFRPDGSATAEELAAADSSTILVVDAPSDRAVHWMDPTDLDLGDFLTDSLHSSDHSGKPVLMATVEGRVLMTTTDDEDFKAAGRRAMLTPAKDGGNSITY